jgi:CheY-like chemotaxis protein
MDERSRGGLGIGLALVKRLIGLHGGSISVHSAGVGQGTQVTMRLPAAPQNQAAAPATAAAASHAPDSAQSKRRILIVDDNEDALESLATLLRFGGHDVRTAANGFLALDAAPRFLPEIAVLDIGMPGLDGYELARRMRAQPWGQTMVLIALTGWGQESDRRRSSEAGFDSHWVKPLDIELFSSYLGRLCPPQRPQPWPLAHARHAT